MRVFVTGATGYIGTALCRRLIASGIEVGALVRRTSATEELEGMGARLFQGDVTDRYSLREGMSGADWVVHAAAELDLEASAERMRGANVEGSENVASLAYKLGVGRLLSISSVAYFGGSPEDGSPAIEEMPPIEPLPTRYSLTKNAGERAIRAWEEQGLMINTVYPSLVYGPPGKRRGANALLRSLIKGRMPATVAGHRKASWVYLEDLVDGVLRVMERAEPGAAYLMAGDAATIDEMVLRVCRLAGLPAPRVQLPLAAAKLLATLTRPYFRWRGYRSPLSREQLNSLGRHWYFDDSRARRELDWHPRSLAEGLPPTVEYLESTP